jgi:hypothetical protein
MKSLIFRCPRTGLTFHSGIQMDQRTFYTIQPVKLRLSCSCCARTHQFSIEDAKLTDEANVFSGVGSLMQQVLAVY